MGGGPSRPLLAPQQVIRQLINLAHLCRLVLQQLVANAPALLEGVLQLRVALHHHTCTVQLPRPPAHPQIASCMPQCCMACSSSMAVSQGMLAGTACAMEVRGAQRLQECWRP